VKVAGPPPPTVTVAVTRLTKSADPRASINKYPPAGACRQIGGESRYGWSWKSPGEAAWRSHLPEGTYSRVPACRAGPTVQQVRSHDSGSAKAKPRCCRGSHPSRSSCRSKRSAVTRKMVRAARGRRRCCLKRVARSACQSRIGDRPGLPSSTAWVNGCVRSFP
jgi:hypothetical protein